MRGLPAAVRGERTVSAGGDERKGLLMEPRNGASVYVLRDRDVDPEMGADVVVCVVRCVPRKWM